MKTLGLLGGMSWESTVTYYTLINQGVRDRLGGLHSARLLLYSVDFAEVERLQMAGDWDRAGALLADAAHALQRAGAEGLVICTNTMHKVLPRIQAGLAMPILHIADATAGRIKARGISQVALLGTRFTMEQDFYRERLVAQGLGVLTPSKPLRDEVHRIIYDELCLGVIHESSRATYRQCMVELVAQGAEGIILGCTEIGLLVAEADTSVPLFDTARIHAEAAVDWVLT